MLKLLMFGEAGLIHWCAFKDLRNSDGKKQNKKQTEKTCVHGLHQEKPSSSSHQTTAFWIHSLEIFKK